MMYTGEPYRELKTYKSYKDNSFEKNKSKVRDLLSNIKHGSLWDNDKATLIAEIKKIVADY